MNGWLSRTNMLIGEENLNILKDSNIAIFGIGGVGSYVAEGLVRAGIGNLTIIDADIVDITNINRQLIADTTVIGKIKVDVAKDRLLKINPNLNIKTYYKFYDEDSKDILDFKQYDYIIDAIDSIKSKLLLIKQAKENNTKIISCMGTGNKLNPLDLEITDIYKTSVCPLAKIMRKELKKINIDKLKVIYSKEEPLKPSYTIDNKHVPGSVSFVPSVAGLIIASEVIKDLINY